MLLMSNNGHCAALLLLILAISISNILCWCRHDVSFSPPARTAVNLLSTAFKSSKRQGKNMHPSIAHHDGLIFMSNKNALYSHTLSPAHHDVAQPTKTNTPSSSTLGNVTTKSHCHHIHLLSLPYPTLNKATADNMDWKHVQCNSPGEETLLKCWSWKDMALGDGADHVVPRRQRRRRRGRIQFIPRSMAIRQVQLLLVGMEISVISDDAGERVVLRNGHTSKKIVVPIDTPPKFSHYFEETFTVEECSVLSTCARLNIIIVLRSTSPDKLNEKHSSSNSHDSCTQTNAIEAAAKLASRYAVASTLRQQILQSSGKYYNMQDRRIEALMIADQLTQLEGARSISSHLCLVASGLAPRPDRPNSDVVFRPYSSRDSHILMQLKHSVEIISVQDDLASSNAASNLHRKKNHKRKHVNRRSIPSQGGIQYTRRKSKLGTSSRGRIKILLDGALRAGKKARNEAVVSEIRVLKPFCSDDSIPSEELSNPAVEAVMERAIAPSVSTCVSRLAAMENGTSIQISRLRKEVHGIVDVLVDQKMKTRTIIHKSNGKDGSQPLKQLANKLLHEPTMQLRNEILSNNEIGVVVSRIERQLREASSSI